MAQTVDVKILILSLVFPPDNVSTAHIVGRLAQELVIRGHEVVALTSTPHYHPDEGGDWKNDLQPIFGHLARRSRSSGMVAYHVWMPPKNRSLGWRLAAWLWFHVATTVLGLVVGRGARVILAPSPPLTIGCQARLLGFWHRIPFVYNVQEVHPDVAVALGAVRQGSIVGLLRRMEDWVYSRAAYVTVIGSGMRSNLIAKGVPTRKLEIISNFVDVNELPIRPRDNAFAAAHGLLDRFVVSYAGNLGVPQGLTTVLDAARRLRRSEKIIFLLIGDGSAARDLRDYATAHQLTNVRFLPFQPYSVVPDIYATSDISLVPQAEGTGLHGLPSKIYRIMACARPILGICEAESEVADLIRSADCGVVVPPNDSESLAAAVQTAFDSGSAWSSKGERGRAFVIEHYSVGRVADQYTDLLVRAASGK